MTAEIMEFIGKTQNPESGKTQQQYLRKSLPSPNNGNRRWQNPHR